MERSSIKYVKRFRIILVALGLLIGSVIPGSERQASSKSGLKVAPQSGWLYVLDSNNMKSESQVFLVDSEKGNVVHSFKAANAPDMTLSPDGSRLYITSTKWSPDGNSGQGKLEVIDTASGATLQTVINPDRWIPIGHRYTSRMAISSDGRWLHIFKDHQTPHENFNYVETFDTFRGKFLMQRAILQRCTTAILLPSPNNRLLNTICAGPSDVRFLKVTKKGSTILKKSGDGAASKISLRSQSGTEMGRFIGQAFLSTEGRTLTVIMGDGRFFKIDVESQNIIMTADIDSKTRRPKNKSGSTTTSDEDDWLAGRWIKLQSPGLSPDGKRLYIGIGRLAHLNIGVQIFDEIVILDAHSLERVGTIKPPQPFFSLALSKDGRYLYAISPEQASIMVIDTVTQREIRTIYGIGETPIMAIVAP